MVGAIFSIKRNRLKLPDHQALSSGPFRFTDPSGIKLEWNGPRIDPLRGDCFKGSQEKLKISSFNVSSVEFCERLPTWLKNISRPFLVK